MGLTNRIEVIDRDGWRREVTVEKSIIYIGSAQHNDLYLDPQRGGGVASTHAQMIFSSETAGCQLVNLTASEILIGGETRLAPEESADLGTETMIQLGDFTLLFHGGFDSPGNTGQYAGRNISLSIFLPANRLDPGRTLTGTARVRNLGSESGVQVDLDIEGLDPGCYSIEPGPVLAAGAEQDIRFRIHHRGSKPPAGRSQFAIRAAARRAYSGEEVVSIQTIQVAPVYDYGIQVIPPAGATVASVSPTLHTGTTQLGPAALIQEKPRSESPPMVSPTEDKRVNTVWADTSQKTPLPSSKVAEAARSAQMLASKSKPPTRLGISGLTLTPDICKVMQLPEQQTGVLVVAVTPDSPAARAGLRAGNRTETVLGQQLTIGGDVITRINDQPVNRVEDQAAILVAAISADPQLVNELRLGLLRGGASMEVRVRFDLPEAEIGQTEAALQKTSGTQSTSDTPTPTVEAQPGEQEASAALPEEQEPGGETAQLSSTGQESLPEEMVSEEQAPASDDQPADSTLSGSTAPAEAESEVVRLTNKAKPSVQSSRPMQLSATASKTKKPTARATAQTAPAEARAARQAPQPEKEGPEAQAATQAQDSWWSPEEEAGTQPQVVELKAHPDSQTRTPSGTIEEEGSESTAEAEPKRQDWWADTEDDGS